MDIQFYGANCFRLTTKTAAITVDDNLVELGSNSIAKPGDIALFTQEHQKSVTNAKLVIDGPGEYEVSDVSILGIAVRAHMDEPEKRLSTIYRLIIDGLRVVVAGHMYPELSDGELESLGTVDVLLVPVGGNGYTLDSVGALKLIRKIEPKLVIPSHYEDQSLRYPVPQQDINTALHSMGFESAERVAGKMKIKSGDLSDVMRLVVLEKASQPKK